MNKFKRGDRVRYFSGDMVFDLTLSSIGETGLLYFSESDNVGGMSYLAHPKQCRKLVKKERRRVWISEQGVEAIRKDVLAPSASMVVWALRPQHETLEFVEVRKRKCK